MLEYLLDSFYTGLSNEQKLIAETVLDIGNLLLKKNADYGNSALQPPLLLPSLPAEKALLVRLSDKLARLANLMDNEDSAQVEESIDDTLMDMAGYVTLILVERKRAQNRKNSEATGGERPVPAGVLCDADEPKL